MISFLWDKESIIVDGRVWNLPKSCSSKAFATLIYSKTSEIFVASNQASFCFNTIL